MSASRPAQPLNDEIPYGVLLAHASEPDAGTYEGPVAGTPTSTRAAGILATPVAAQSSARRARYITVTSRGMLVLACLVSGRFGLANGLISRRLQAVRSANEHPHRADDHAKPARRTPPDGAPARYGLAAEGEGFEPSVGGLPLQRFSRPPRSTTPAPLRGAPAGVVSRIGESRRQRPSPVVRGSWPPHVAKEHQHARTHQLCPRRSLLGRCRVP